MRTLAEILSKYPTDKNTDHSYAPIYEELLSPIRQSARTVVELGVLWGGSLRAWRDFFPSAMIYGVDVDPKVLFREDRICCVLGDQNRPADLVAALSQHVKIGSVDLIVDDALHDWAHQMSSLFSLWDFLRAGGLYVIEDAPEGIGRFSSLPYVQEFDLRAVKGRWDDILYVFRRPG